MTPSPLISNFAGSLNCEGCIFPNYLEVAKAIVVSMGLIENSRKSIVLIFSFYGNIAFSRITEYR